MARSLPAAENGDAPTDLADTHADAAEPRGSHGDYAHLLGYGRTGDMTSSGGGLDGCRAAIDVANSHDPRDHNGEPLALAQGRMAEEWVLRLAPRASDALRLAARAHHLRRWELPRSDYPPGRAGYLRWRRAQQQRHARDLATIAGDAGVDDSVAVRTAEIVSKQGLGSDPEVQTFEDAVSLTFLETELGPVAARLADNSKAVPIVAKTLTKMSDAGREQAQALAASPRLFDHSQRILAEAMAALAGQEGQKAPPR